SKKMGKGKRPGNGGNRYFKSIGLGFKTPREAIERTYIDKKCLFTGNVSIRGRILAGTCHSAKMNRTIIVRRNYLHYVKKYQRQDLRHSNIPAHISPCFRVKERDHVIIGQCRPLSKIVRFNLLKVIPAGSAGGGKKDFTGIENGDLCLQSMTAKESSKKIGKGKRPGKGGNRYFKSIGLGFKTPRKAIEATHRRHRRASADPTSAVELPLSAAYILAILLRRSSVDLTPSIFCRASSPVVDKPTTDSSANRSGPVPSPAKQHRRRQLQLQSPPENRHRRRSLRHQSSICVGFWVPVVCWGFWFRLFPGSSSILNFEL
ncbi:40S ribosomal protein S11, partial [Capsicum baccatum]